MNDNDKLNDLTTASPGRRRSDPVADWYQQMVESAPDALILIDAEGCIVLANAQAERLFGYTREELLGESVEMLVPERHRHRHVGYREEYFTEPKTREMGAGFDLLGLRKDGNDFPVEISLSPLRTDKGLYTTAAIRDVTGRKKEQSLLESLLETAPDAMVVIDQHGRITQVNAQAERLFGYHRDNLVGKRIDIFVPEDLRKKHRRHVIRYLLEPKSRPMGKGLELHGRRKDGSLFPMEVSLSPLVTDAGMLVTAAIRDITERKKAGEQIAEYARSLERSNSELEQFAYVASHDLQSPLRNITSFARLLKQEVAGKVSDEADEYFEFIIDSAKRMQALIGDLLELSKVGQVAREPTACPLNLVVEQAVRQLQSLIEDHGATVEYDELPTVRGDEQLLVQLMQNMIGNGMKFQAEDASPIVEITAIAAEGGFWRINVKDNGIGIDEEHMEGIFQIFRRLHTQEQYPGTGIGLSLCKKIVEEFHGGRIGVESELGKGTTFWFTLPSE